MQFGQLYLSSPVCVFIAQEIEVGSCFFFPVNLFAEQFLGFSGEFLVQLRWNNP